MDRSKNYTLIINLIFFLVWSCGLAYCIYRYWKLKARRELKERVWKLHKELQELEAVDPFSVQKAIENQFEKYARHSLQMECQPTNDVNMNQLKTASRLAENKLRIGSIDEENENLICQIYGEMMKNTNFTGRYRVDNVKISRLDGSLCINRPRHEDVAKLINDCVEQLNSEENKCPNGPMQILETAIETKMQFMFIHPFPDANGMLSSTIFNGILRNAGFPWIPIPCESKLKYLQATEEYYDQNEYCSIYYLMMELVEESLQEVIKNSKLKRRSEKKLSWLLV
ncbi:uncharacterized protein LOC135840209 [Planococcus citri]|uniref:uncharacterized protein LOC135840209 n=1 Tax=Planococcus citri TaxID=170843 RepID=UPI0031F809F4